MNFRRAAWLTISLSTVLLSVEVRAADVKPPDPDLPERFDPGVAKQLLENPPFTRALNLSESLMLTGVAFVEGRPIATVRDKTTNQSYVVTEEPNSLGWRLAGITPGTKVSRTEAKIIVGSEIVPVHYSETQLAPPKKASMPSKIPTTEEFTGHDDKGAYVRGMPYLNDEDREKFKGGISKEVREKFLNVVHDNREFLFKASHEERAAFVKKTFDAVVGK